MFNIAQNEEFLKAIGVFNAPEKEKQKLIAGLEDLAEKRLVIKIADSVDDKRVEEFNTIKDEAQAFEWVKQNIPELPSLIAQTLEEMRDDILEHKERVLE